MFTYENLGNVISVDLKNGYRIVGFINYNKDTSKYDVRLYLDDVCVNMLDYITTIHFDNIGQKLIKSVVLKRVAYLHENKKLEKYIARYAYQLKCFDMGNDFFENFEQV